MLSGWLTPDGEFHPCGYQEHQILAIKYMQNEELRKEQVRARLEDSLMQYDDEFLKRIKSYVPMGGTHGESYLHLPFNDKTFEVMITDKQREWFKENFDRLGKEQKTQVSIWIFDEEGRVESG